MKNSYKIEKQKEKKIGDNNKTSIHRGQSMQMSE